MDLKMMSAWMLQLSNYFIKQYKYQIVSMTKSNTETWLVNPKNKETPIIMVSIEPSQDFKEEAIGQHREMISLAFNIQAKGISISVNPNSLKHDDNTIIMTPQKMTESFYMSQFTDIEKVLSESNNAEYSFAKAVGDLRKTLVKSNQGIRPKAVRVTTALVMISIMVYFISMFVLVNLTSFDAMAIIMGGMYKPLITHGFEFFRFITSAFVNLNIFQLMLSIMVLNQFGQFFERYLGSKRYLLMFVSGLLMGNLGAFIAEDITVSIGVAPALSVFLGYLVVNMAETKLFKNSRMMSQTFSLTLSCVLLMFLPNVSFMAVVASFMLGILFGFIFSHRRDWVELRKGAQVLAIIFSVGLIGIGLMKREPIETPIVNEALISSWEEIGFIPYLEHLKNILN